MSARLKIDCGGLTLLTAFQFVANLLVLVQRCKSGAFNGRDVYEHILGAVFRLDEAEALLRIEPFNSA